MSRQLTGKEIRIKTKYKKTHFNRCVYCGKIIVDKYDLTVDHKTPLIKNGKTINENLAISCYRCNQQKDNLTYEEYKIYLKQRQKEIYIEKVKRLKKLRKLRKRIKRNHEMKLRRQSTMMTLKEMTSKKKKISKLIGGVSNEDAMFIARKDSRILDLAVMKEKLNMIPMDNIMNVFKQIES
jgi:hypothetical protein